VRTVTLVSRDPLIGARLRRALGAMLDLRSADSLRQALEAGPTGAADALLLDFASARIEADELSTLAVAASQPFLLGLVPAGDPLPEGAGRCDLVLSADLPEPAIRAAVEHGLRLRRLERELATLRQGRARPPGSQFPPAIGPVTGGHLANGGALGTVLKEMGKLLAAHFDLDRVVDFFLDAITELVRPGRTALLLLDEDGRYRIRGHRGLDPALAERVRLGPDDGLPAWFRREARLAVRAELEREPEWLDGARELTVLGGEVAVPLWVQAKLVGVLALGPRVTGQPYSSEDLERLFTLASQVAMAVEDIALFNTVRAQHGFIEQVLAHLQSGAITIDTTDRVTRFNRRAEEILGLPVGDVLGRDLRVLPSPLGDLLFDTMRRGRELRLQEISLPQRQSLVLEVSTSRILGPSGTPVGAVMLLDDPTPRHLLHRERQTSQTLDLLNRVLLRLTDEIKNPLVSIYTFLQLLPQRYDDPEFRETFLTIVGKDTQRLISLVDNLMTLAGDREYKFDFCNLRDLLNEALEDLALHFDRPKTSTDAAFFLLRVPERGDHLTAVLYAAETRLLVKADRDHLGKAIGYLVRFLANRVETNGRLAIHVLPAGDDTPRIRLWILGKPATLTSVEREHVFSPLAIASERLLDVGPGVSQKIIEAHGGTLTLGGQEGEIRFQLTLPRAEP
jgi:nitrogen-specific signal transduction histidine kinase